MKKIFLVLVFDSVELLNRIYQGISNLGNSHLDHECLRVWETAFR